MWKIPIFTIWYRNILDFFTMCCFREILKLITLLFALFLSSITSNKEGLWPSKTESARMSMADAMMFMTSNSNSRKVTNYPKQRRHVCILNKISYFNIPNRDFSLSKNFTKYDKKTVITFILSFFRQYFRTLHQRHK